MEIKRKMQELPVRATVPTGRRVLIARSFFSLFEPPITPPPSHGFRPMELTPSGRARRTALSRC